MTCRQIASMNVHPVDNPQNSLITISDLKEAARSCGFTSDPYSTPIIDITNNDLFVTSKNEFFNSPIHEFKLLQNVSKIKKQCLKCFLK